MIASILTVFDPLSSLYSRLVSNNKKRAFKFYHNKVVFVTGASSGIGECICKQLSSYGANLILVSRDIAKLHQVMKECEQVRILSTQSFAICPIDIERYNDINVDSINKKLVEYNCCFTCYDIDIVVLNAGVSSRGSVVDTDMKTFEKLMNVNFFGNTALIKAILPSMLTRGKGDISVVSSVQGKIGIPLRSSYAASKFALQGFFDSLRSEIAHKNINILIVSPGYVKTSLSLNAVNGDGSKYGKMDETTAKGMEPSKLAVTILDGIVDKKKDMIIANVSTVLGIQLGTMIPSLFAKIIQLKK